MESKNNSPLVLGTAQLGHPYGIANKAGQPNQQTVNEIIKAAWEGGIRQFDTAQNYGVSETVLGNALKLLGYSTEAQVISKFDTDLNHLDHKTMNKALDQSINLLHVPSMFGMMLHHENTLKLWDKGLVYIVKEFIRAGKIKYFGVSVYSTPRAIDALNIEEIDFIQVPANILDRRFEKAGIFDLAQEKKKMIYIRSIFLQGLIFIDPDDIPKKMKFVRPVIRSVQMLAEQFGMNRDELALGYIKQKIPWAKVIVGAETPVQIRNNIASWERPIHPDLVNCVENKFCQVNKLVTRPEFWPK